MKIGVIGGTGIYEIEGLEEREERTVDTPFGSPSGAFVGGRLEGRPVWFLPRHGKGHRLLPFEINYRANIYAFKLLDVDAVISLSAVGSLREDLSPGDMVVVDQFYDRTKDGGRHTFFGRGVVAHIPFGRPVCEEWSALVARAAEGELNGSDRRVHRRGTYVNMEGPAFSTRAESETYRRMGFDVIGMTGAGEAKLCREAELPYACLALVTDYDCWREQQEDEVSVGSIVDVLRANAAVSRRVVRRLMTSLPDRFDCSCRHVLAEALLTPADEIPPAARRALSAILNPYLT